MAYAHPSERRILVPVPPPSLELIDPAGTLALNTPAPPLPPLPPTSVTAPAVGYFFPLSGGGVLDLSYTNPIFVPGNPKVLPPARAFLRVNPAFFKLMDDQRTESLLKFMVDEGLEPSHEDERKRRDAINQLKGIVLEWVKKVAWQRRLPTDVISSSSATILTYGSYGLGVHGSESDIDALCVGPCFTTMEEDFFIALRGMLENRAEVSEIHCVKSAKVPLMRFKFNGISVDFPYAQLPFISVPEDVNIFDRSLSSHVDETSWRSLSGVRANKRILQLVPNLKNFQSLLRCVKLWARRRGVYGHLFGFFGGIHLAILVAFICQKHPNASVNALISVFLETYSYWPWPEPVILQDQSIPYRRPDGRSFMPIMMPCYPFEWCYSNITRSTYKKIILEFQHGCHLTRLQDPKSIAFRWDHLFETFPYAVKYPQFLRILLTAPNGEELLDWVGWVKSRFRSLLLKLEMMHECCDPNPTEFVDHYVAEPNAVFYWGLSPGGMTSLDIDFVKEEFMKSVKTDLFADDKSIHYKLELSIIGTSQLPKTVQLDSGGVKGSKPCWRIADYNHPRKPVYSMFVPEYIVGYVSTDRERQDAFG